MKDLKLMAGHYSVTNNVQYSRRIDVFLKNLRILVLCSSMIVLSTSSQIGIFKFYTFLHHVLSEQQFTWLHFSVVSFNTRLSDQFPKEIYCLTNYFYSTLSNQGLNAVASWACPKNKNINVYKKDDSYAYTFRLLLESLCYYEFSTYNEDICGWWWCANKWRLSIVIL